MVLEIFVRDKISSVDKDFSTIDFFERRDVTIETTSYSSQRWFFLLFYADSFFLDIACVDV